MLIISKKNGGPMNPLESYLKHSHPNIYDIPEIHLYMDQLIEFIEGKLIDLKRQESEPILTKTMVNNYVKSSLLKAPNKKKYDQESICDLILIYHLKQVFSMQDIQSMLSLFKKTGDYVHYYNAFLNLLNDIKQAQSDDLTHTNQNLSRDEAYILMQKLAIESAIKKQMAEQLLDFLTTKSTEEV